ncbi:MAG: hypothetical protein GVY18_17735 [Bacteroidetes bacterium]|jgi:molybdopterin converting factor small subunit|nr:hypothetical protein [Bacteroidota bacterium]
MATQDETSSAPELPSPDELDALQEQAAETQAVLDEAEQEALAATLKKQRKKLKKERKKLKAERKKKDSLGTSRGIETMFRTSYRQHVDLSALADNKANIMISINGIIISIIIASISPKIDANPWLLIPTSVLLVGCLMSLIFAVLSARPRVTTKAVSLEDVRSDRSNILFFGNFVNMNRQDYLQGMEELVKNTDRLYRNMMRDIYSLGQVLQRKFRLLRVSYTLFMIGLILGVVLFIGVYVWLAVSV